MSTAHWRAAHRAPTARTGTPSTGAPPRPTRPPHSPRRTRRSHCRAARRLPRRSRIAAPLVAPLAAPHAVQRCLVSTCGEDEKAHTMGQRHWRRGEGRWRGEEVAGGAAHLLVLSRPPCLKRMVAAAPCRRRRLECPRGAIGTTDRTRWPCLWAGVAHAHVAALAAGAVAGSPAPFLVCPSAPVASKSSSYRAPCYTRKRTRKIGARARVGQSVRASGGRHGTGSCAQSGSGTFERHGESGRTL